MITVYSAAGSAITAAELEAGEALPAEAVWIDLNQPTAEEEARVEAVLGIDVPTREEMQEIEPTSRLYRTGACLVMTATVVARSETSLPSGAPVTFVLMEDRLISVRYADPAPFHNFAARLQREPGLCASGRQVLIGVLEAIVDRVADILERESTEIEQVSRRLFRQTVPPPEFKRRRRRKVDYDAVLMAVGRSADLLSKLRDSLVTLGRLVTYVSAAGEAFTGSRPGNGVAVEPAHLDRHEPLQALLRDIQSLSDHANALSNTIIFLLDATLGMIGMRQTDIIKIFSVVSVVFLPPTLIASIYGMNFAAMPELQWHLGYPLALVAMVISAILPWLYFKWRGWL